METNKNEKSPGNYYFYIELLKVPITTLCIVLGLAAICYMADINLSRIVKISTTSIELSPENTQQITSEMESKINLLEAEIKSMKTLLAEVGAKNTSSPFVIGSIKSESLSLSDSKKPSSTGTSPSSTTTVPTAENKVNSNDITDRLSITEVVKNNTIANLSYIDEDRNTSLKGKEGYIWIGQYDGKKWLTESILSDQNSSSSATIIPKNMRAKEYQLTYNMKFWEIDPSAMGNDNTNNKMIGVIPSGIPVKIVSVIGKDEQYWAKVKVEK